MWTPVQIFALTFLLNHSPMEQERLSVREIIIQKVYKNQNKLLIEDINKWKDVGLRNDF